jgi:ribosomal protein L37AE/L43A
MSALRGEVYHCPYCGGEDLRPHEEPAGAWLCRSCARVFTVRLVSVDESRIPAHSHTAAEEDRP